MGNVLFSAAEGPQCDRCLADRYTCCNKTHILLLIQHQRKIGFYVRDLLPDHFGRQDKVNKEFSSNSNFVEREPTE